MELSNSDKNILIVDDTPENLTVLRQMLSEHGYRVRPALSGEIALKTIQADLPDLILLDIVMPGMSGFKLCSILKADEKTCNIPIIFISALSGIEDKMKAFSDGGVDYISKPFNTEEVLARVKTHLTLHSLVQNLENKNHELEKALTEVKRLQGLLPICAQCKKIRDDNGYWKRLETYFEEHSDVAFSHGMCPTCMDDFYGEEKWYMDMKKKE